MGRCTSTDTHPRKGRVGQDRSRHFRTDLQRRCGTVADRHRLDSRSFPNNAFGEQPFQGNGSLMITASSVREGRRDSQWPSFDTYTYGLKATGDRDQPRCVWKKEAIRRRASIAAGSLYAIPAKRKILNQNCSLLFMKECPASGYSLTSWGISARVSARSNSSAAPCSQ